MITEKDVHFHPPKPGDYQWAETNFFAFYLPERNLCGSLYVVTRQDLGVAMADVSLFDRLSLDRKDCLYVDTRQHLPLPEDLSDYMLANGLSVKSTRPPLDYEVKYDGGRGVAIDLQFKALMAPYDIHDESDPQAAVDARAAGEDFDIQAYNGHFDLSGRVTGTLRIGDETLLIDCVDTMDHSWGPRPEDGMGINGACWMHAHFGDDYVIHAILLFDITQPIEKQYSFIRGYVMENGETYGATAAELRAIRINDLGVSLDLHLTDVRGRQHRISGSAVSGTNVPWYACMDTFYALYRWNTPDGRVGYGCSMEAFMIPNLAGRADLPFGNHPLLELGQIIFSEMLKWPVHALAGTEDLRLAY